MKNISDCREHDDTFVIGHLASFEHWNRQIGRVNMSLTWFGYGKPLIIIHYNNKDENSLSMVQEKKMGGGCETAMCQEVVLKGSIIIKVNY